jgi:hypothetical protein
MACPIWPNWAPGGGTTAATLLQQIIVLAGTNPDAADAKAAAQEGLVTTAPKNSPTHNCLYYYNWVVGAKVDADGGDWDACTTKLGNLSEE